MNTRNVRTWKAVSVLVVSTMFVLTTLFAAPEPVALATETGYRSPTADSVYTTGLTQPNRAYADDTNYAFRNNNADGVAHVYRDYGFSIPADAVIQGIQVRLDWWMDDTSGTNAIRVYLSYDGGTNWTAYQSATTALTTDGNPTDIVGGTADTWGRTWSPSEFSDANFRVRLELSTTSTARDFRIDWVPVQVTYTQPPVAVDDGYSTPEDTPLTAAAPGVLGNDTDADGDPLTAIQEAGPASGTLVLDADGSFVYTPTLNFNGVVTFTYHANDGTANSNTATVPITVTATNDAPVAVDDGYSTPEDTPLTAAAPGVLGNDTDADGDPLTAIQEAGPASGTLVLDADGSFVYTPTLNFNGVVTFTYHANDGIANSNTATVAITVTATNDAPTFTSTPVTTATEEIAYTYSVTAADVDNAVTDLTITAPILPGSLTLTDNGDGTATLTGTPTHTDIGDHPVVLQVSDGAATTTQPFTITVSAQENYYVYLPALFKNY
jgi:VCBS repeat-containing protein